MVSRADMGQVLSFAYHEMMRANICFETSSA